MVEPITTSTIVAGVAKGVAVKAITSLAGKAFKLPEHHETLAKIIDKSIDETSYVFEWKGSQELNEVCIFLDSPEVQQLVEQMFSVKVLEEEIKIFDEIENEFVLLFELTFGKISGDDRAHVRELFKLLLENIVNAIDGVVKDDENRMIFSLLTYQNNRLESLIQSVSKNINFLKQTNLPDLKDITDFEEKYRSQLYARFSSVKLSNLDTERKIYIDNIYVNPKLSRYIVPSAFYVSPESLLKADFSKLILKEADLAFTTKLKSKFRHYVKSKQYFRTSAYLSQDELYGTLHRVIILGNPGGGKSTLTYKICTDLHKNYKERPINNKLLSPIHVKVRDFGEQKSKNNLSIVQFMESVSNSSYQLPAPPGAFEYLLHNGRALVIFDGLDELLDTSFRKVIVEDIESFCNLYPAAPVLVTSREVGYEQAPLDRKSFQTFRLASFDEEQVKDYTYKYFDLEEHLSKEEKKNTAESFLRESEIAKDLRSNPLMLGLMCSIYRGEKYIPQNKPELYEKCSIMLFERWDKSRGIDYPHEKFAAHIKPGMVHLAHWIYTTENLQSGVKETELIKKTADYLEAYFPNRNEAEFVAKDFVEFCSGRAWVFTDTGQGIYQFTHQTFLEYFTARYLNQTYRTPKEIAKILLPKIEKREWDVVAHLALNILNDSPTEIADEIISIFLDNYEKKKRYVTRLNILSFMASSLDYAVLTYKTVRRIVETCLDFFVESTLNKISSDKPIKYDIPLEIVNLLLLRDSRNKESIWNIAEDYLLNKITNSSGKRKKILIHLVVLVEDSLSSQKEDVRKKLITPSLKLKETISQLSDDEIDNAIIKFDNNQIDIEKLVKSFGTMVLHKEKTYFECVESSGYRNKSFIYRYIINTRLDEKERLSEKDKEKAAKALNVLALTYSPDIHTRFRVCNPLLYPPAYLIPLSSHGDELFGSFLFIAPIVEKLGSEDLLNDLGGEENFSTPPAAGKLFFTLLGRLAIEKYKELIEFEISNSGLSEMQKSVIWRWVRKEISFNE